MACSAMHSISDVVILYYSKHITSDVVLVLHTTLSYNSRRYVMLYVLIVMMFYCYRPVIMIMHSREDNSRDDTILSIDAWHTVDNVQAG